KLTGYQIIHFVEQHLIILIFIY
ncbi:uncharacterized protein METZ01_LOCUS364072, partial [marine metagenome]